MRLLTVECQDDGMSTEIRYPRPLRPGDTVAVTAPSAPVRPEHEARLTFVTDWLRGRGFEVVLGECLIGDGITSGSARARADEFNAFVRDQAVRAVVPPWGGELAIDLVDLLDHDALRADPTWVVGWSDISTLLLPLTLRSGVATMHGQNLMDAPYGLPQGTVHWLDAATMPARASFIQEDPRVRRRGGFDDWERHPCADRMDLSEPTSWRVLAGEPRVDVSGRLIGGCLDVVCHLAGTPYGDVRRFARDHEDDGVIVYLENCEAPSLDAARMLHGLRLAGWFEGASAVLIGRTSAPKRAGLTQDDAILDALGNLNVPIVADVDFGHVPPGNVLINGSLAHVVVDGARHEIRQTFV